MRAIVLSTGETVSGRLWDTGYFIADDGRYFREIEVEPIDD